MILMIGYDRIMFITGGLLYMYNGIPWLPAFNVSIW